MSGGKKKKSLSSSSVSKSKKSNGNRVTEDNAMIETSLTAVETSTSAAVSTSTFSVDVLDRLAPPILFFPPNVSEEYLNRFCPEPAVSTSTSSTGLLADEGFPDREIPVMRRLLAMMAGIMSKASAASTRAYYSRVAGTEGRRNGYFQQNLNTSVFNLFSTLSAAGNANGESNLPVSSDSRDLHLTPPVAFTAKDGETLRGYPQRLMKFWRQLSPAEQLRLVREEHAALTNSWIESRKSWCLCAHCKHRRMTISDLTDCLYQTYCEELEAFISSGGQGSSLYSANLTNSMEPAARARRFLFKSLSVVGEQALLPRYNQFILRLEAFSSMAFSLKDQGIQSSHPKSPACKSTSSTALHSLKPSCLKSAALQASKEFLQKHGRNPTVTDLDEEMTISIKDIDSEFDPKNPMKGLSFKIIQDSDEELEEFVREHRIRRSYPNEANNLISDSEGDSDDDEYGDEEKESHQGGIQSEDDDDLIDDETDLPIDESELMLPGGSSFPLLPAGEGPVQWSESSRIECGRTVFLMFASEMFQYRLTAAYLSHQTRLRQIKLIAEVEEEERLEKEKRLKDEKERKERAESEKKKKAAKKEKAAAKASGNKNSNKNTGNSKTQKPIVTEVVETKTELEHEILVAVSDPVVEAAVSVETEPLNFPLVEPIAVIPDIHAVPAIPNDPGVHADPVSPSIFDFSTPIISVPKPSVAEVTDDDDDFDPTELVEQLAKEMNRFELNYTGFLPNSTTSAPVNNSVNSPPGFAPPPGFPAASPKHLVDPVEAPLFHYPRPPFAMGQENDEAGGMVYQGYQQNYRAPVYHPSHAHGPYGAYYGHYPPPHYGNHSNYQHPSAYSHPPPPHHYNAPPQPPPNSYHQPKQAPYNHNSPSGFSPFDNDDSQPSPEQSRFQSFFSKSIFGPSSFFSQ